MKKFFCIMLLCGGSLSATTIKIEPTDVWTKKGEKFSVDIVIEDVRNLEAAQVRLLFDREDLKVETVTEGSIFKNEIFLFISDEGYVFINGGRLSGPFTGEGSVASISFSCISDDPEGSLTLSDVILIDSGGGTIPIDEIKQGYIHPLYFIKGYIKESDDSPIKDVKVLLLGDSYATYTTSDNGYYEFINLSAGTYTITPILTGYVFIPSSLTYLPLTENMDNQNFVGIKGRIYINPTQGFPDETITIEGKGFFKEEEIEVFFSDTKVATATTKNGKFKTSFIALVSQPGTIIITARGITSHYLATTTFLLFRVIIELKKEVDKEAIDRGIITYTIYYRNIGNHDGTNITIYDYFPENTRYISHTEPNNAPYPAYYDRYGIKWYVGTLRPFIDTGSVTLKLKVGR